MDTQTFAIVALAINVAILVVVIAVAWYQRRARAVPRRAEEVADVAGQAITSTIQGDSAVGGGALDAGSPWFSDGSAADARPGPDGSSAGRLPRSAAASATDPEASLDAATGFEVGPAWTRWLAEEETRILRFHRPATVVLIELSGLDRLADRLGDDVAERLIPPIATTLRRDARATDRLARLGPTRFAALLVETSEVAAINWIERVRTACDVWLEAGAVALRLSVGWAEIGPQRAADVAVLDAERRLFAERERARRQLGRADDVRTDAPVEVPALQQSGA
jgi:diguanylate cyclase (GGDEF)-like protein